MSDSKFWLFAAGIWIAPPLFVVLTQVVRSSRLRWLLLFVLLIGLSLLGLSRLFALSLGIFLPFLLLGSVVASSPHRYLRFGYVVVGAAMMLLVSNALNFLDWRREVILGFWSYVVIAMLPPLNHRITPSSLSTLSIAGPAVAFLAMIPLTDSYLSELDVMHSPGHENRAFVGSLIGLAVLVVLSLTKPKSKYLAATVTIIAIGLMLVPTVLSLPPDMRVWLACALMIAVGIIAGRRGAIGVSRSRKIRCMATIAAVLAFVLAFQFAPLSGYHVNTGVGNVFLSYVVFVPFLGLIAVPYGLMVSLWFPVRQRAVPESALVAA